METVLFSLLLLTSLRITEGAGRGLEKTKNKNCITLQSLVKESIAELSKWGKHLMTF